MEKKRHISDAKTEINQLACMLLLHSQCAALQHQVADSATHVCHQAPSIAVWVRSCRVGTGSSALEIDLQRHENISIGLDLTGYHVELV